MRVARSSLLVVLLIVGMSGLRAAAQESTPVASPIVSPLAGEEPYDPVALYEALLRTQLDQHAWPSDATGATAAPWVNSGNAALAGTVAAVQITFEGSTSAGLAFAIYPTAADAKAGLDRAATQTGGVATPVATPEAATEPTVVLNYGNFTVCLIQVNNVLVDGAGLDSASAIAIARAGVEHVRNVEAVLPPGASTPEPAAAAFGSVTPVQLNQRLQVAQFSGSGLPAKLTNPQVTPWTGETDTDLVGTVGAAYVTFTGGDNHIAYLVFPDSTAAELRVIETSAQERASGADVTERTDLTYPAEVVINGADVLCVMQVDYVLVVANATLQNGQTDAAIQQAIALAQAGADHLVKIATAP